MNTVNRQEHSSVHPVRKCAKRPPPPPPSVDGHEGGYAYTAFCIALFILGAIGLFGMYLRSS